MASTSVRSTLRRARARNRTKRRLNELVMAGFAGLRAYANTTATTVVRGGWAAQAQARLQVRFVRYVYNFNIAITTTTTTGGAEHYGLRPLLVDAYRVYVYGVIVIETVCVNCTVL